MLPEVIDIINKQTSTIISCLKKEKSLNNINKCSNKGGNSVEIMISKLIPKQINALCLKDTNDKLHFVWNEQNYTILVDALNETIFKNKKNKKCILESNSSEEYAKCLVKFKAY